MSATHKRRWRGFVVLHIRLENNVDLTQVAGAIRALGIQTCLEDDTNDQRCQERNNGYNDQNLDKRFAILSHRSST